MSSVFDKQHRLLKAVQFQAVFQKKQGIGGRYWVVFHADNGLPYARLGLAISKKKVALSVQRNRLKRLCREHFRKYCQQLPSSDLVVLAKQNADKTDNAILYQDLQKLLVRITKRSKSNGQRLNSQKKNTTKP